MPDLQHIAEQRDLVRWKLRTTTMFENPIPKHLTSFRPPCAYLTACMFLYAAAVKRDLAERQLRTKTMLDNLDPLARVSMEGQRPGTYVRMRFTGALHAAAVVVRI